MFRDGFYSNQTIVMVFVNSCKAPCPVIAPCKVAQFLINTS